MYFYGPVYFDWTYGLLIVAMLISAVISARVNSTYKKYARQVAKNGLTAEQAAQRVLAANGVYGVGFARIAGELTDNYNPRTNVISLSDSVCGKSSVAAIGVACHEAGHAVQHALGYGPVKLRTAMVPITNIGSRLAVPLFVLGLVLDFMGLVYVGIALFSLSTLFQLVTLPVEFNASRRALVALEEQGLLYEDELKGAKKVLSAAALTYVAALATSALMLLRYISIAKRRD
ncbi:MAG: zinc metallopeptidase [Clostridia bacterium]|nr:zinc metallopeptidase [Clostridia bacterium]